MFASRETGIEKSKTHGKGNKNYKTAPCERYAAGICHYGKDCWFIHDPTYLAPGKSPSEVSLDASVTSDGTTTRVGSPPPPPASTPTKITAPLSARVKAHPSYKTQQCYAFKRSGKCERGDNCTYRHNEELSPRTPSHSDGDQPPTHQRSTSTGKQPCFDLLRTGMCPKGELCIFSHESPVRHIKWYRGVTCKLWLAGNCKHGDTCLFRHAESTTPATAYSRDRSPGVRILTPESVVSPRYEVPPSPTFGDNIFMRARTPIQDSRDALYRIRSPNSPLYLPYGRSPAEIVNPIQHHRIWDNPTPPSRGAESSSSSSSPEEEGVSSSDTVDVSLGGLTLGDSEGALIAREYSRIQTALRRERESRVSSFQHAEEDDVIYQPPSYFVVPRR